MSWYGSCCSEAFLRQCAGASASGSGLPKGRRRAEAQFVDQDDDDVRGAGRRLTSKFRRHLRVRASSSLVHRPLRLLDRKLRAIRRFCGLVSAAYEPSPINTLPATYQHQTKYFLACSILPPLQKFFDWISIRSRSLLPSNFVDRIKGAGLFQGASAVRCGKLTDMTFNIHIQPRRRMPFAVGTEVDLFAASSDVSPASKHFFDSSRRYLRYAFIS